MFSSYMFSPALN